MKKNHYLTLAIISFMIFFTGCVSSKISEQEKSGIVITKYPDTMMWNVSGLDADGNEASIDIFGVINVSDERLIVPQYVSEKFLEADSVVSEVSLQDFMNSDLYLAEKIENSAVDFETQSVIDDLTDDEFDFLIEIYGMEQLAKLSCYEPWILEFSLNGLQIEGEPAFTGSITNLFLQYAMLNEKEVFGLETMEKQLEMVTYGDWNYQVANLKRKINQLMNYNPEESSTIKLYEAYLANDLNTLESLMFEDHAEKFLENQEFVELYVIQRNKDWANQLKEFLNKGGRTFAFIGLAQLLGENSVLNYIAAED